MKKFLSRCQVRLFFYTYLFFSFLITSCQNPKKNNIIVTDDAIAYAFPMSKIVLDGDLSEWPKDMTKYQINNAELGKAPKNKEDFEGNFRIGYNVEQNELYIAMEISDESQVVQSSDMSFWDNQDGLELYINEKSLKSGSPVTQYSEYGNDRNAYGARTSWDNVEMVKNVTENGKTVEWKVTLDKKIEKGMSLGIDLVAIDKDRDKSFTWLSWGRGTQKVSNPDRLGNIIFIAEGTDIGLVKGKVDTSNLHSEPIPVSVRMSNLENEKMWVQTVIDSLGNFSVPLPVGDYKIEVPTKIVEIDYRFHRMAPTDPITFSLRKDGHDPLPSLEVKMLPEPDVIPSKGLLHDFDDDSKKQTDQIVKAYQEHYNIPGVSLALIKDGQVVYHKTYGVKNSVTSELVDEKTLFEAASITKPVFAFVVLRLADRNIINLDKPLHEYLPFEQLEKYPEYKKITARHVLIHRSGLPNWGIEMINEPGEKYGYSGEGFEYLKRVVVKITGKPIEQVLNEELIEPNDLYHMEFSDSDLLRKVVSDGHVRNHPTNWGIPQEAGMAFSMHTEAKAFAKYALAILERKGLKPTTYNQFLKIHTESNPEFWNDPNKAEGAGLGIFIRKTDYGDTFYHGGNNGDFKCQFEVYDKLKMGYIIYTNSDTGSELTMDAWQIFVEGKKQKD
ncbi:serine hydrolase [Flagellimonas pacifica]|uniref:CubicO group peptidase, beta-lactamase class C family n=1 Tax=Flagellimonas pacifica TaxID=1247520 RepID=A0A285MCN5_9FLAO|nr:serine hydrolase [Allomuricauda parva]SNY94942.1 CubicO group peptidase, beta-lactamase class C family [Allomuricauda parva]